MRLNLVVNGVSREAEVPPLRRLLDVLREDLGLTGTKEGCGEGECGACSVVLDGQVVDACLVPICQVDGRLGRTVEGLAPRGADAASAAQGGAGATPQRPAEAQSLDDLQRAFLEAGAARGGICPPGMLMAARVYIDAGGTADEDAIREAIAGNLCRCTGYTKIID